jgi:hypothetical protein
MRTRRMVDHIPDNKLGEYRRAIEDYDQALRINPGYAPSVS